METELKDRIRLANMKSRHLNKIIPWYKKWWGIIIIILSILIISFLTMSGIYIYQSIKKTNADRDALYSGQRPDLIKLLVEGQGRPYLGNTEAEIVIVEFADFACPYCMENEAAIKSIIKKHGDKVKFIFRNVISHPDSESLSLAAFCAGEQEINGNSLFWPMHDRLFELQGRITETDLTAVATSIGAEPNSFSDCLNNKKYLGVLRADMEAATTLELTGSPTWFINNYKVDGFISEEELESMVAALTTSGPAIETSTPITE